MRRFLPLVQAAARRFRRRLPPNVLYEDLVAAGTVGLLDALRRDDPNSGPAFEWYARVRIRGAIIDDLRAQDWLTRRARELADTESMRPPSFHIISLEDLSDHVRSAKLVDDRAQSALDAVITRADREAVQIAVQALPAREQSIVRKHYFQDVQLKTIAAELGVSDPRVSQLHTRAIGTLKCLLRATCDEAA